MYPDFTTAYSSSQHSPPVRWSRYWFSIILGLVLTLVPLPESLTFWRPEWIAVVLYYWLLRANHEISLGQVFGVGLLLDTATGSLLGQHALGLVITGFVIIRIQPMMRVYPVIQQAFIVALLLTVKLLIVLWVAGLVGRQPTAVGLFFMPALTSLFIWPLVVMSLDRLNRLPRH